MAAAEAGVAFWLARFLPGFQTPAACSETASRNHRRHHDRRSLRTSAMQKLVESFIRPPTPSTSMVHCPCSLRTPSSMTFRWATPSSARDGVRDYLERFFVGYHTKSRLLSLERLDDFNAPSSALDFTGDFGHEIGVLKIAINADGLIERIDADLE
jgi:hypothetical protein